MTNATKVRAILAAAGALLGLLSGCLPLRDLDSAAGGRPDIPTSASAGSIATDAAAGGTGGTSSSSTAQGGSAVDAPGSQDVSTGQGGTIASGGTKSSTETPSSSAVGGEAGGSGGTASGGMGGTASGGMGGTGGSLASGGMGGTSTGAAGLPDLPSPIKGQITYSPGATWNVDGEQWPAFEIHTPSASYWLIKASAAIASITDTAGVQWINYYAYRANRGVPNLGLPKQGGCCQPGNPEKLGLPMMTTEIDPGFTVTSTHLRLVSKSDTGSFWLVWDFFLTHFTLTINRADTPFGFTYRGVPGGAIDTRDQLVLSSGETLSPSDPYQGALSGTDQWVYYNRPMNKHALFLIQHTDDDLVDSYQIADGDSAMWTFGGDASKRYITQTPIRFSLGVMDSSESALIVDRIKFVVDALRGK
jgi:hypothetical protein